MNELSRERMGLAIDALIRTNFDLKLPVLKHLMCQQES